MNRLKNLLAGKKGLVTGLANQHSIAYGCAKVFHQAGAELLLSYGNAKSLPFVEPLAQALGNSELLYCDVSDDAQLEALFQHANEKWGELDFVLHAIAFAPRDDLHGRVVDCSREGFTIAMDVSCYSFIRMSKLAEPLMKNGGCLLTMSYYGAEKVVDHYNIMGPVKAALESSVRYLAAELGEQGIRVNAISPGPLKTRAASGIDHFDELLDKTAARAPGHKLVSVDDVGFVAATLVSDLAEALTGQVSYVDAGYHIMS